MFYDRKKYTFYHNDINAFEIEEPLEWKTNSRSFVRNEEYHGMTTNLTDKYTFVGDAKEYLSSILDDYGVNANVKMIVEIRNEQTDIFEVDFIGYIDFMTYVEDKTTFIVKFNTEPLVSIFKSKLSSSIELERLTDIKGEEISRLSKETLQVTGRDILLISKLSQPEESDLMVGLRTQSNGNEVVICVDLRLDTQDGFGIDDVQSQYNVLDGDARNDVLVGKADENFYDTNELGVPVEILVDFKLKMSLNWGSQFNSTTSITFGIRLVIYENDDVMDRKTIYPIYETTESDWSDMPIDLDISWNNNGQKITIGLLEGATIQFYLSSVNGVASMVVSNTGWNGGFGFDGTQEARDQFFNLHQPYYSASISVQEDSSRPESFNPTIMIYEFVERLNDIILQSDFRSDLLGRSTMIQYNVDGAFSQTSFSHGMWFRGMDGQDKYKPISTSLKNCLRSINVVYPIGIDISDNLFRLEERSWFYQTHVSIVLGEVSELSQELSKDDFFTLIKVGYEKAGGYEENQGLDEYNRLTEYNTIIEKTDNILELVSFYRSDGYGLEDIRRDNPLVESDAPIDKDSKFDDNIWMMDVELPSGQPNWIISNWTKRFANAPLNVYSPDTAMMLWFSPINILLKHGKWIKPMLLKYLDSDISFNFSEGNSQLKTKLIGGIEYTQNIGIPASELANASHTGDIVTFKALVTWEQLNGSTKGRRNVYGLVDFSFQGVDYKGHIMSVNQKNGVGEWKVKLFV